MDWRRRLAISLSSAGRHSFRYSTTVTSLPRLLKMEANSIPMTPAPTMQSRRGTSLMLSNSVDVTTFLLSMPGMGSIFGLEPVAMMMLVALYSSSPTMTVRFEVKRPVPCTTVIPGAESSVATPFLSVSTTWFLRSITRLKSNVNDSWLSPKVSAFANVSRISALRASVFVGMQPQLRQVPPNWLSSMMVTVRPNEAACSAAR